MRIPPPPLWLVWIGAVGNGMAGFILLLTGDPLGWLCLAGLAVNIYALKRGSEPRPPQPK